MFTYDEMSLTSWNHSTVSDMNDFWQVISKYNVALEALGNILTVSLHEQQFERLVLFVEITIHGTLVHSIR